jgi:uncharacterized protein YnzC (UPF0291/DUF896 family)
MTTPLLPKLMLPKLTCLPLTLPMEGAVRIELEEGIPVFRASSAVIDRIEELLSKQKDMPLEQAEEQELNSYEEIDDYLSFVNRVVRNVSLSNVSLSNVSLSQAEQGA